MEIKGNVPYKHHRLPKGQLISSGLNTHATAYLFHTSYLLLDVMMFLYTMDTSKISPHLIMINLHRTSFDTLIQLCVGVNTDCCNMSHGSLHSRLFMMPTFGHYTMHSFSNCIEVMSGCVSRFDAALD